jgi:hypothetical protein
LRPRSSTVGRRYPCSQHVDRNSRIGGRSCTGYLGLPHSLS